MSISPTCLLAACTIADPKAQKDNQVIFSLFLLLGSARLLAAHNSLVKLTPFL